MKRSTVIHTETITEYFQDGVAIENPTAPQKLMAALFGETRSHVVVTDIEVIEYNNKKERDEKFWAVVDLYSSLIPANELSLTN